MAHPYPPRCPKFDYRGRHRYLLTLLTFAREPRFSSAPVVQLALEQILRAAREKSLYGLIAIRFLSPRKKIMPSEIAGVAITPSPIGFLASSAYSAPALITKTSPSSLVQ